MSDNARNSALLNVDFYTGYVLKLQSLQRYLEVGHGFDLDACLMTPGSLSGQPCVQPPSGMRPSDPLLETRDNNLHFNKVSFCKDFYRHVRKEGTLEQRKAMTLPFSWVQTCQTHYGPGARLRMFFPMEVIPSTPELCGVKGWKSLIARKASIKDKRGLRTFMNACNELVRVKTLDAPEKYAEAMLKPSDFVWRCLHDYLIKEPVLYKDEREDFGLPPIYDGLLD